MTPHIVIRVGILAISILSIGGDAGATTRKRVQKPGLTESIKNIIDHYCELEFNGNYVERSNFVAFDKKKLEELD